jgi:hypothetical protein
MSKFQPKHGRTAVQAATRMALLGLSVGLALTLAGCWPDDSSDSGDTGNGPPPIVNTGPTVSGAVIKGPVSLATVTAYVLNADGSLGASLGSGSSAADGSYSFKLSSAPSGPIALVAVGGSYVSEADGATVSKTSDLIAIVPAVDATAGISGVVLTPLSDIVSARTRALMGGGAALAAALTEALGLVGGTYGLPAGTLATLLPRFDKAGIGTPAYTLGLILGSLDTCDKALPSGLRGALFAALSADLSDGVFDGKRAGTPVAVATGTALNSTAGTSDFLSCVSGYAASGKAVTDAGVTVSDLAATVAVVRTALVTSPATPRSTGLSTGSSGAISSLAYGGKQWLFIAARSAGVVAVDITDPTAASPTVKVYSGLVANNFGNHEIGGVVPLIGADHPQLLVFAYGSKHIALVNADTGVVEYESDLPLVATAPIYFSGGNAYIAGAIPDTGRDGVWLATADGYLFFDRATRAIGASFPVTTPAELAENIGGDIEHGILFGANYEPGVQIADIGSGKSYYMGSGAFNVAFPSISEPDGGAVDTSLRVGIVTDEDSPYIGLIDLRGIVKTDVPGGRNTFAPAAGGSVALSLGSPTISGSAVDSDSHLVLFMAGYSNDVAVGQLQDPATVPSGGTWQGLTDWRYVIGLSGYSYARDPHAAAVIKNLSNNKAYGYLLDGGSHKSLQIDMAAFLAAPAAGSSGNAAHQLATNPGATIVKSITW